MTTTRNDIHRPSAAEFDPQAYEFVDAYDFKPDDGMGDGMTFAERQAHLALIDSYRAQGYKFAVHVGREHKCGHCGAWLRYAALMVREDVKEMIYIGETCLDGRFELTKPEFDRMRKASQLDREQQRLLTAFNEMCAEHPELVWATYAHNIESAMFTVAQDEFGFGAPQYDEDGYRTDESKGPDIYMAIIWSGLKFHFEVLPDIARKARQYGSVSDKQFALIARLTDEIEAKWEAFVTKQAAMREAKLNTPVLTAGRQIIEGAVKSFKTVENDYGVSFKMLVELADGRRVYGTVPSSINPEIGDTVRFTAKVEPKDDDPTFGFYSRPTKAEVVSSAQLDTQSHSVID